MKARRGRGGYVREIVASNLMMRDIVCPIVINSMYRCGAHPNDDTFDPTPQPISELAPALRA